MGFVFLVGVAHQFGVNEKVEQNVFRIKSIFRFIFVEWLFSYEQF